MESEISSGAPFIQPNFVDRGKRQIDSSAQGTSSPNSVQPSVQKSYEEIVEEWYVALYEEDSLRLQKLLEVHPDLWAVGWESEERKVTGRRRNYWMDLTESEWMGRTALHVGARRGNVDLLENVLDLCILAKAKGKALPERLLSGQDLPVKDPTAAANQNNEEADLTSGSYRQWTRDQIAAEEGVSRRESNANKETRDPKSPSSILEGDGDGKERSMEMLLLAKDGEYKLDAIAMAIVNGNQFVVAALLIAGSTCEPVQRKYNIRLKTVMERKNADGLVVGGLDEPKDGDGSDVGGPDEPKKDVDGSAIGVSNVDGSDKPKKDVDGSAVGGSNVDGSDEPKKDVDGSAIGVSNVDGSDEPKKDVDGSAVGGSNVDGSNEPKKVVDGSAVGGSNVDGSDEPKKDVDESAVGGSNVDGSDEPKKDVDGSAVGGSSVDGSDEPKKDVDESAVGGSNEPKKEVDGSAVEGPDESKDDVYMRTRIKQKYWDIIHELNLSEKTRQCIDLLKKDSTVFYLDTWLEEEKLVRESEWQKNKDSKRPHEVMRRVLTLATRQVIENFRRDGLFRTFVLDRYDRHRDFNFLPKEEFLFHFLSTGYNYNESDHLIPHLRVSSLHPYIQYLYFVVQDAIMRAVVRRTSPGLMQFLWKLHDGQGRPPLHVAVDEINEPCSILLSLVRASSLDENLIREILYARDGAGRTVLHRSIVSNSVSLFFPPMFSIDYDDDVKKELESFVIDLRSQFLTVELQRSHDHGKLEHEIENLLYNFTHSQPGEQRYGSDRMLEHVAMNITPNWGDEIEREFPAYHEAVQNLLIERESRDRQTWRWTSRSGTSYWLDENAVSDAQGFTGRKGYLEESARAPLHSAIIHQNLSDCKEILRTGVNDSSAAKQCRQRLECSDIDYSPQIDFRYGRSVATTVNALEVAALNGDMEILKRLLEINGCSSTDPQGHCSALQIAAALGRYDMLQLLKDKGHDPLELDQFGNSALHYALRGMSIIYDNSDLSRNPENIFNVHLTDYVSCEQILKEEKERKRITDDRSTRESVNTDEILSEKERCINLLIQEGCDIFKPNQKKEFPHPKHDANLKLHSWWQDKQTKEFAVAQNAQNTAANAISVIAALVATASYVGPLQPPLGYSENDPAELQLGITAVKVFIICDTMSFYLAIAAIIAALVPCLPMPQQSMIHELRRTTHTINVAVAMLFPSIIFVLVAFAAASIAVIQTNQTDWNRGVLTKATASIGGFFCLFMITIFSIRVLAIVFHNSKLFKKLYRITSYENLVDIIIVLALKIRDTPTKGWEMLRKIPLSRGDVRKTVR